MREDLFPPGDLLAALVGTLLFMAVCYVGGMLLVSAMLNDKNGDPGDET